MKEYPTKEARYGIVYCVAHGVNVYATRHGTWELVVKYGSERSKKRFAELEVALRAADLLASRLGLETKRHEIEQYTMEQAAEDWLALNRSRWSEATRERYAQIVRDYVMPVLGAKPLERIDRRAVKEFLVDALADRAAKTVELLHAVVSGIFTEAIDGGKVADNPAEKLLRKILPPKAKRNESMPDPLSIEDLDALLTAAWKHLPARMALIMDTLASTGMRLGEVLAMHADHLDMRHHQYMVSETMRRGRYGLPKYGKRLIDLPEHLTVKLERHIKNLRVDAFRKGEQVGYLFAGVSQNFARNAMRRACDLAKIRTRSPHDLRHTYASLLLMDHCSPAYVQKQLGHQSISMTVDTYGHWIPGEGRRVLSEGLLRPLSPNSPMNHSNSLAKQK